MSLGREEAIALVQACYQSLLRREADDAGLAYFVEYLLSGRSIASVLEVFKDSEEFKSQEKLFVPPGHYYPPVVNTQEADWHLKKHEVEPVLPSLRGINLHPDEIVAEWRSLLPFLTTSPFPDKKGPHLRYAFDNPAYAWGDGSVLHAMLRKYRPKRLIEIGSGWSSACVFDTVENYLGGACELTFIEPYPQLLRELVGAELRKVKIYETAVQKVELEIFDALEAGDFLFIDSTHVVRTGSDVCFELFDILPRLARGVIVHIHDIFWPFEYPRQWVIDENRSWNEIYAVRAFLTDNPSWKILMFNDYLMKTQRPLIESTYPKLLRSGGAALWLQRN